MRKRQFIIIGAGEAGVAAASTLREAGYDGSLLLISEEQYLPYERPPLSKELLLGTQDGLKPIRPEPWYAEQEVDLRLGVQVEEIDVSEQAVKVRNPDGSIDALEYDKLLLATGARVRELPGNPDGIIYLRTHDDGMRLRERLAKASSVVIIGGGVIGLEVASSARAMGLSVTVMDPAPRLMARAFVPEVSEELRTLHESAGVRILTGVSGIEVTVGEAGQFLVHNDTDSVASDLVVAGIGVVPNVELGATAGCAINNGIVVDGAGQTSVANIYAAGDVAAFHHPTFQRAMRVEAWQHAGRHGAHVARAMVSAEDHYCEIPWFWTDQHGVNFQVAGTVADCDATHWRGEGESRTAFHFSGQTLVAVTTINNGRDMRPATKLLAAGWRGHPTELLDPTLALGKISQRLLTEMAA